VLARPIAPPEGVISVQCYLGCLSQASYLIGDETAGPAAMVDPGESTSTTPPRPGRGSST
jgi:hypothetical protein